MEKFYQTVEEIRTQNDLIRFRNMVADQKKKLVIFGAGDCGHRIYDMLRNESIEVSGFCDNKLGGVTDQSTGLKISRPESLNENMSDWLMLISMVDVHSINSVHKQLLELGFGESQILNMREYFYRVPLSFLEDHIEEYKMAYELLEEDFSRRVYLARMKRAFIVDELPEIVSPHEEEYFDEKVRLTEEEVFIDCGGYDGDTSVKFLEKCRGRYKEIVIFEPESCKKTAIEKNMAGQHYELYQAGVWSEAAKLNFFALGTDCSFVTEKEGKYVVDVVSLDETVYNKRPTFIKMDIEGSEQEAIKGSEKILKEYRPKLAVCIYHKPDDLFRLPLMIKKINPSYQLYVRQYSASRTGTVLYAL